MTEFMIKLLRLRGDERWSEWGTKWWERADTVGDLPVAEAGGWQLLDHFREKETKGTQLDWGALLFPVSKQDLIELYSEETKVERRASRPGEASISLSKLPDENYGLVVVECS